MDEVNILLIVGSKTSKVKHDNFKFFGKNIFTIFDIVLLVGKVLNLI